MKEIVIVPYSAVALGGGSKNDVPSGGGATYGAMRVS